MQQAIDKGAAQRVSNCLFSRSKCPSKSECTLNLKTANFLITKNGDSKLLDFGIAKLLGLDQPSAPEEEAANLFTTEYATLEQVMNRPISTTNAIYSLGVIIYELFMI